MITDKYNLSVEFGNGDRRSMDVTAGMAHIVKFFIMPFIQTHDSKNCMASDRIRSFSVTQTIEPEPQKRKKTK